jgi:hypothetical protein
MSAATTAARADVALLPLFSGDCDDQRALLVLLERLLAPPIAVVVAAQAARCLACMPEEPASSCRARAADRLIRR